MIIDNKDIFDIFRFNGIDEKTKFKRIIWTSVEAEYEDAREMFEYLTGTTMKEYLKKEADRFEGHLESQMRQSRLVGFELSYFEGKNLLPYLKLLYENGRTSLAEETILREKDAKKIKAEAEKELKARL